MLSILIPIYNHNVKRLINELYRQLVESNIHFEIICIDDFSSNYYRKINRDILNIPMLTYTELTQNIGRAKIRNQLAKDAKYDKLLFLDSDSKIKRKTFIKSYLKHISLAPVINGGRVYTNRRPTDHDKILHYDYGTKRESKSSFYRNKKPGLYFHTNNFMIEKRLVIDFPFEESLTGYGYEDLAMAANLQKQLIEIKHIDNPIIHKDLDKTQDFLAKIEESMMSLAYLYEAKKIKHTPLLKLYTLVKKSNMKDQYLLFYNRYQSWILKNLFSARPSMRKLDMFKLYHFCIAIDSLDEA